MAYVDVVIVSYNSERELRETVEVVLSARETNVIVVDNASSDESLAAVENLPITTVALEQNRGFAHGCNVGWRRGDAPFVLFLNPDATIAAASLAKLVAVAESDPRIGAVAPKIVDADGNVDPSLRRFPRLRSTYAQALFLHRLFPRARWSDELVRDDDVYDDVASPEWVSGACVLVPRAVLERLGGWDEGFFLYCEDVDLCRRIRDAGLDVRYEPGAVVSHKGGASAPRASLLPVLAASRVRYARKHNSRVAAAAERLGIALGALTHVLVTRGGPDARQGNLRSLKIALLARGSSHRIT